jgi:hypothetical protein
VGSLHRARNLDNITPECALRDVSLSRLQSPMHERWSTRLNVGIIECLRTRVVRIGDHERFARLRKRDEERVKDGQLSPKERVVNAS